MTTTYADGQVHVDVIGEEALPMYEPPPPPPPAYDGQEPDNPSAGNNAGS